jgi:predicted phosphoribosyltransferase
MTVSEAFWSDRRTAGLALAARLRELDPHPAGSVVVGLPRGGVVVAAEVARALHLPLTTWSVRKLALPTQPEIALGALAPGGVILWDPHTAWMFDEHPVLRDQVVEREGRELERRRRLYGDADPSELKGRQLIVVDDGIATGLSVRAALTSLQRLGPARVVLAVPVAAHQSLPALRELVDELVLLAAPDDLVAVGLHYGRFDPVADAEVLATLRQVAVLPSPPPEPS